MKQGDLFGSAPVPAAVVKVETVVAPVSAAVVMVEAPPLLPSERSPLDAPAPAQPAWRRPVVERRVVSVSELTAQVKELLEPALTRVLVRGEVSGFRGPNARGHLYFSIKDQFASIEVRIWQSTARLLKFALRDGLSVVVEGAINVYEPQGRYSVIAQRIEPEGVGARALAFEQLKQKLSAEGLIGERRTRPKRALPMLPRRIGVVTSISGAALRDFLKVLHRRHPRLSVVVCDARVQGEGAGFEVARAIRWFQRVDIDVLVVTRGGGSIDDLWAFNEEPIARAIFASRVPVVSAVGHEIDTTLADLVSDVRAPTPSAAAEAVAPVLAELTLGLSNAQARLRRALDRRLLYERNALRALGAKMTDPRRLLTQYRMQLSDSADRMARVLRRSVRANHEALRALAARLQRARPQDQLKVRRAEVESLSARLAAVMRRRLRQEREAFNRAVMEFHRASPSPELVRARQALGHLGDRLTSWPRRQLAQEQERLRSTAGRLDALSPLRVLARGYALVQLPDGRVLRAAADVRVGDEVKITVAERDEIQATVSGVKRRFVT